MGIFSSIFGNSLRKEAERLGFKVNKVSRQIPTFTKDNQQVSLETGSCLCYSLPRRSDDPQLSWKLLQRTKEQGATMPSDLERQLKQIAEKYSEDYFEFEASSDEVLVYCEEFGSVEDVQKLYFDMDRLASW